MQTSTAAFTSEDQQQIHYHYWLPAKGTPVRAILQIVHGMAEHAARYARFAALLCERGYAVYASDHRGHGRTAGTPEKVGYFSDKNFWESTLKDLKAFRQLAQEKHPKVPIFLFGHSMGSLLSRDWISRSGGLPAGVILSATAGDPGALLNSLGLLIAKSAAAIRGRQRRNALLNTLTFGKFNQSFRPNRTTFDWLSRDDAEVDKYVADPYCGPVFTTGFFVDLLGGVQRINQSKTYDATPDQLPILLIAGERDPVGDMGEGVRQVYEAYRKVGVQDVVCKLYPQARHELLNETNREEVVNDLLNWMEERLRKMA
ncbi:MAG: alpha/beta hydrolase [Bacteroidota bacterium]